MGVKLLDKTQSAHSLPSFSLLSTKCVTGPFLFAAFCNDARARVQTGTHTRADTHTHRHTDTQLLEA